MESISEIAKRAGPCTTTHPTTPELKRRPSPEPAAGRGNQACVACGDTGYTQAATGGELKPCVCQVERRIRAAVPKAFWLAQLTDFSAGVQEFAWQWLADPLPGLFLSGKVGRGKTHLAAALVRIRREQNKRAVFRKAEALYEGVRECFSANLSVTSVLHEYFEEPFVVLDDVGAGTFSDFERRTLLRILDVRGEQQLVTVVTSNLDIPELGKRVDDRVGDRLASFHARTLEGKSWRVKT